MTLKPLGCLAILMLVLATGVRAADDVVSFDIPKLSGVTIDGKGDDWGDKGFRVESMCDVAGKTRTPDNFNASFKIGWDERGLLLLVTVTDDVPLEPADKAEDLWQGDSIEFFIATKRGSDQSYQVVIAPGRDPRKPELRSNISDYRKGTAKKEKLSIEAVRTVNDKGYVIEALLPWKNLGIEAKDGAELAFQLYANDADKENERYQALWYPKPDAHSDTNNTHTLRLSDTKTSAPVLAAAAGNYDGDGKAQIVIVAGSAFAGKSVTLKEGDKALGDYKFESEAGRAVAKASLPKADKPYGAITALSGADVLCTVNIPEAK